MDHREHYEEHPITTSQKIARAYQQILAELARRAEREREEGERE